MNKLVKRFVKLSGAVLLLYVCVCQVLYKIYYDSHKAPFKIPKLNAGINLKHLDNNLGAHQSREVKPGNKLSVLATKPGITGHGNTSSARRKFVDTLLIIPQQSANYHHNARVAIWPDTEHPEDDRVVSQMMYNLPDLDPQAKRAHKKILVYSGFKDGMQAGTKSFVQQKCPVSECDLTADRSASKDADVILWQNHISLPGGSRPLGQIWMVFFLESPYHTPSLVDFNNKVNWTSTYRRDSTIVAPYERFTLFNSSVTELPLAKNYASGKTKKVAWFVSNCGARNNRLGYAKELAKYIEVDIYGACGSMSCPRNSQGCFNILSSTYKFYLAFENSNCRDYITEKFFVNGLKNDVLPIVMGAHPDDYRHSAPKNAYIHVDDFESPKKLADYLHELDKNDEKYNQYFRWKGTGDNINTYFWCRLCAMTHAAGFVNTSQIYTNVDNWWRGPSVCKELTGNGMMWPRW